MPKKQTRFGRSASLPLPLRSKNASPMLGSGFLAVDTGIREQALRQTLADEENFCQGTIRNFKKWNKEHEGREKYEDKIENLKSRHKQEYESLQQKHENVLERLREMEKEKESLKEEKENLLTRVADVHLSDNNPDISDLSDSDRPQKLNEKISNLYDKEWTDAIEIMETDQGEQPAIGIILNIVMVSTSVAKCAKDAQKTSSEVVLNESSLLMIVWKDMELTFGNMANKCEPLINKCAQICWLMCVQDPPMCLVDFGRGLEFNSNEMRSFTKSGKFVDFVVWPALYLHEDGPLLSKAVVQGPNHPAQQKQQMNQQRQHRDSMIRNNGEEIKHSKPVPNSLSIRKHKDGITTITMECATREAE